MHIFGSLKFTIAITKTLANVDSLFFIIKNLLIQFTSNAYLQKHSYCQQTSLTLREKKELLKIRTLKENYEHKSNSRYERKNTPCFCCHQFVKWYIYLLQFRWNFADSQCFWKESSSPFGIWVKVKLL